MLPDRLRGRVPLPEAGEGHQLAFLHSDLQKLRQEYGENYFQDLQLALDRVDPDFMLKLLVAGIKDADGVAVKLKSGLDDVNLPLRELSDRLRDGIMISVHGKLAKEWLDEMLKEVERMATENPQRLAAVTG